MAVRPHTYSVWGQRSTNAHLIEGRALFRSSKRSAEGVADVTAAVLVNYGYIGAWRALDDLGLTPATCEYNPTLSRCMPRI